MKSNARNFLRGVGAGLWIAIATIININSQNYLIGAVCFSIALLAIVQQNLYIYTGYCINKRVFKDFKNIVAVWLGNFLGASFIKLYLYLFERTEKVSELQLIFGKDIKQVFLASILCGAVMYFSVVLSNKNIFLISFGVFCFIIGNFIHSVASMVIFWSMSFSLKNFFFLILASIGNLVGAKIVKLFHVGALS